MIVFIHVVCLKFYPFKFMNKGPPLDLKYFNIINAKDILKLQLLKYTGIPDVLNLILTTCNGVWLKLFLY